MQPPRHGLVGALGSAPRIALAAAAALALGCNALLDIDGVEFSDATGSGLTTSGGVGGAGGGAAAGGTAGHGGAPTGGGGAGGAGGSSCTSYGPFGTAMLVENVNSAASDWDPAIASDGLTLFWGSDRTGTAGGDDVWYATRPDTGSAFSTGLNLVEVSSSTEDDDVEIAFDGLTLYLASDRTGGAGLHDLWYATRPNLGASFGAPAQLADLASADADRDPAPSKDELTLFFSSDRSGGAGSLDIWVATRPSLSEPFGAAVNVSEVNSSSSDENPALSPDGLTLYFSSTRSGGVGDDDIWYAERPTPTSPFGPPQNLTAVNTTASDADPVLTADGLTLFFGSNRTGGVGSGDIWMATRSCL